MNENEYGHILTIEDPIEFVHESKKCLINQREVGPHTLSFANALRSALREDPDVILVGEMRDLETIRLALTARRDRPPGVRHAAHHLGRQDHRPDRRRVPGRRKGDGARDAVGVAARGDLADAVQDQGRQRARRGARDHDRHAGHPQPDPREQGRADVLGDPDRAGSLGMQTLDQNLAGAGQAQPDRAGRGAHARPRTRTSSSAAEPRGAPSREAPHGTRTEPSSSCTTCCARWSRSKGSDLFITADFPPAIKVDGKMTPVSQQALTAEHTLELARSIMNDKQAAEFEAHQGVQLRDQPGRHRPLPRQRLRAAGPASGMVLRDDHDRRSRSSTSWACRRC